MQKIFNLTQVLKKHASSFPNKEALVYFNVDSEQSFSITYKNLLKLIRQTADYLQRLGIKNKNRISILSLNSPEILILELAASEIGAGAVPLDGRFDTLERKVFKLNDTNSKVLFVKDEEGNYKQELEKIKKEIPGLKIISWKSFTEFQNLVVGDKEPHLSSNIDPIFLILYTSGTTANPKGVLLPLSSCIYNAMGIIKWQNINSSDRFNIILPLHHINSTIFSLTTLIAGGTIILNSRYSSTAFWKVIEKFSATITSIVPTVLHDLLTRYDEYRQENPDTSSLKRICIGSAPVLPEETLKFYQKFGIRVYQGYGQTETALRVAGVPTQVDEETYLKLVKTNSIGTHLAYNQLAIMDERNSEMKEGIESEICAKGPVLANGYLNNPEENKKAFKKGWFHTGDLGFWKFTDLKSKDGEIYKEKLFFIKGRIKEIIIKGGDNLSPSYIEDAIVKKFPEAGEVCAVGYPDERMGEEIAIVITPVNEKDKKALPKKILSGAIAGELDLSKLELPKKILVFDSLPKTSTGKIQRSVVREQVSELLKSDVQKHYYVRRIKEAENRIIRNALKIHNDRWKPLALSYGNFVNWVENGTVFGVFESDEGLVGSVSCLRLKKEKLDKVATWKEVTQMGTFENNDPKGNSLVCVSITVKGNEKEKDQKLIKGKNDIKKLAEKEVEKYVASGTDHVLSFHQRPKNGVPGAKVYRIIPNSRPEDKESMGYNVIMKYPEVNSATKVTKSQLPGSTPAELLIQNVLYYAKERKIKYVFAFSRPAEFRTYPLS